MDLAREDVTSALKDPAQGFKMRRGKPWMREGAARAGEKRILLLCALETRQFDVAALLMKRQPLEKVTSPWKPLELCDYTALEVKYIPKSLNIKSSDRLGYLMGCAAAGDNTSSPAIVFKQYPDLLNIAARVVAEDSHSVDVVLLDNAVILAARHCQVELVRGLLEQPGASFNVRWSFEFLNQLLLDICFADGALMEPHIDAILELIDDCKKMHRLEHHPFLKAVQNGRQHLVEIFLENGYGFMTGAIARKPGFDGELVENEDGRTGAVDWKDFFLEVIGWKRLQGAARPASGTQTSSANKRRTSSFDTTESSSVVGRLHEHVSDRGWTLLSRAVYLGHYGIAKALFKRWRRPTVLAASS